MSPIIKFVEFENGVVSATYINLMVRAKVVVVNKASGQQLSESVVTIASAAPNGSLRIKLPDMVEPGTYYLKALNGHGEHAAQSAEFDVG